MVSRERWHDFNDGNEASHLVKRYYTIYHDGAVRSLEFPSPPIGDIDCRDVIIQKPCIVGAQPTGNYAN